MSEWKDLCVLQLFEDEQATQVDAARFEAGGQNSVERSAAIPYFREAVDWQERHGWPRAQAVAYTLLFNHGRGAIGKALSVKSSRFAACTHTMSAALVSAAARHAHAPRDEVSVPLVAYSNLFGDWGLAAVDSIWATLQHCEVGSSFMTHAPMGAEAACEQTFPDGRGIRVPLTYDDGTTVWELQRSPVVRFRSRPADLQGFHSLVQTSATAFDLPPLTQVTLRSIEAPGTWSVHVGGVERRVWRSCYTVDVTFG